MMPIDGITLARSITEKAKRRPGDVSAIEIMLSESVLTLKRHLDELSLRVGDMAKTACGTYNEKRVSVDKKKFRIARDVALLNVVNQPSPETSPDSAAPPAPRD